MREHPAAALPHSLPLQPTQLLGHPLDCAAGCFWGRQYDFIQTERALGRDASRWAGAAEVAAAHFYAVCCAAASRCRPSPLPLPSCSVSCSASPPVGLAVPLLQHELHACIASPHFPPAALPCCCSMSAVVGYAGGRTPSQADGKVCYYSGPRGSGEPAVCCKSAAAAAAAAAAGGGDLGTVRGSPCCSNGVGAAVAGQSHAQRT